MRSYLTALIKLKLPFMILMHNISLIRTICDSWYVQHAVLCHILNHIVLVIFSHASLSAKHTMILLGVPGLRANESPSKINNLITLSRLWRIHLLETICVDTKKEETDFNPSVSVLHNSEMGAKLRDGFLRTRKWTDVSFTVEGMLIQILDVACTQCLFT